MLASLIVVWTPEDISEIYIYRVLSSKKLCCLCIAFSTTYRSAYIHESRLYQTLLFTKSTLHKSSVVK